MATKLTLITIEDISCRRLGYNFEIVMNNGEVLNFTKEAIDELKKDIEGWENDGWVEKQEKNLK